MNDITAIKAKVNGGDDIKKAVKWRDAGDQGAEKWTFPVVISHNLLNWDLRDQMWREYVLKGPSFAVFYYFRYVWVAGSFGSHAEFRAP